MEEQTQTVIEQNVNVVDTSPTATSTPTAALTAASTHIQAQQIQQQQQNQHFMEKFWTKQLSIAEEFESDFKNHPLPLARIKKVMKSDQEVKAPIIFSKACEIFISEITMRAWIHAEENKRRTLQRSDVASALSRSDQFDFLIDIVPREEVPKTVNRRPKEETDNEWNYVISSDDSIHELFKNDSKNWVWQRPDEKYKKESAFKTNCPKIKMGNVFCKDE
nr:12049_t:CDS:2 [Entrophospora candida]